MKIARAAASLSALFVLAAPVAACQTYDSPPRPSIDGLVEGVLPDANAPIVLRFSEPVLAKSLKVEIAPYVVDEEGNLGDEDQDTSTDLDPFFTYSDADGASGGSAVLSDDRTTLTITPLPSLPIAKSLVLLVEPGVSDDGHHEQKTRERILFSYEFSCKDATPTTVMPASGVYFFVINVADPIPTQIQLFADIEVDQTTGLVQAEFVNADRNPDPNRCMPACMTTEACQTLPSEMCVIPSTKAGSEDEYPDFVPNSGPPAGYTFGGAACVSEKDGVVTLATEPTDVVVPQPAVTVQRAVLTASFKVDDGGVLRATGSLTSPAVFLGPVETGAGSGTLAARLIPADEAPMVPPPQPD